MRFFRIPKIFVFLWSQYLLVLMLELCYAISSMSPANSVYDNDFIVVQLINDNVVWVLLFLLHCWKREICFCRRFVQTKSSFHWLSYRLLWLLLPLTIGNTSFQRNTSDKCLFFTTSQKVFVQNGSIKKLLKALNGILLTNICSLLHRNIVKKLLEALNLDFWMNDFND